MINLRLTGIMGIIKSYKKRRNQHRRGVTAVEFALILPVFALMTFSILELGIVMFVKSVVNNAVLEAGRFSVTGDNYEDLQVLEDGEAPVDAETFIINRISERLSSIPFGNQVPVVKPIVLGDIESFAAGQDPVPGTGTSDQIVMYQVDYNWPVLSPIIRAAWGKDGNIPISAKTIIKKESF